MTTAELQRLAHSEYWDERYAEVGPDEQVHEWFRSFNDLMPFLDRHLFQAREPETCPRILHLGSGDSVSFCTLAPLTRPQPLNHAPDNTRRSGKNGLQEPDLR